MQKQALAIFWTLFASFSVVVVNTMIQLGLERMTKFEKYHSLDQQQLEVSIRVFVLKFINTGKKERNAQEWQAPIDLAAAYVVVFVDWSKAQFGVCLSVWRHSWILLHLFHI